MTRLTILTTILALSLGLGLTGCASEGDEGTTAVDCGTHGSEHDGHCHCDSGYLNHADTCVPADEVTELCEADADEAASTADVAGDDAVTEEHHHEACLCPATGECPCDHGTLETLGTAVYCVPELHEEE